MSKENFVNYEIGSIKIVGENTEGLPMWSINHYIEEFCNNYNKIIIVRRICELMQEGAYDAQFLVAKRSATLFPNKPLEESFSYNEEDYFVLTIKSLDPLKFWHIVFNYVRPIVFYKDNTRIIPLLDFKDDEAIKITSMNYNSPVNIDIRGAIGGVIDIANAKNRRIMEEEEHMARQIGELTDNYARIANAYQVINDHRTPEGVKYYANRGVEKLMQRQEILNTKLGIRIDRIDSRI